MCTLYDSALYILCMMGMYVYLYIYICTYALYVSSMFAYIYIYIFILCILYIIYTYFRKGCLLDLWNMHFWEAMCGGVLKHLGSEHLDSLCSLQTTGWWKSKCLTSPKIDTKNDTHCPYRNKHPKAPKSTRNAAKGCFTGAPLQATRQRNDRQWQSSN